MPERPPQFAELQRLLCRAGIVDASSQRLIEELQDHYRDLREEALAHGCNRRQAHLRALQSIGAASDIASVAQQYRELLSFARRYPLVAGFAQGLVHAVSAPAIPVFYCAARRDSIARWSASIGLAGIVTATLLLSLHSLLGAI